MARRRQIKIWRAAHHDSGPRPPSLAGPPRTPPAFPSPCALGLWPAGLFGLVSARLPCARRGGPRRAGGFCAAFAPAGLGPGRAPPLGPPLAPGRLRCATPPPARRYPATRRRGTGTAPLLLFSLAGRQGQAARCAPLPCPAVAKQKRGPPYMFAAEYELPVPLTPSHRRLTANTMYRFAIQCFCCPSCLDCGRYFVYAGGVWLEAGGKWQLQFMLGD